MTGAGHPPHDPGNLRLPVPFFDLLIVLLVCFMVFVAPAPSHRIAASSMDIPVAGAANATDAGRLIAAVPQERGWGWAYELADEGRLLDSGALARYARESGRKVVMVVPAAVSLQRFLDMQAPLQAQGITVGLAVRKEEAKP